jgi:hypothetical protein
MAEVAIVPTVGMATLKYSFAMMVGIEAVIGIVASIVAGLVATGVGNPLAIATATVD